MAMRLLRIGPNLESLSLGWTPKMEGLPFAIEHPQKEKVINSKEDKPPRCSFSWLPVSQLQTTHKHIRTMCFEATELDDPAKHVKGSFCFVFCFWTV